MKRFPLVSALVLLVLALLLWPWPDHRPESSARLADIKGGKKVADPGEMLPEPAADRAAPPARNDPAPRLAARRQTEDFRQWWLAQPKPLDQTSRAAGRERAEARRAGMAWLLRHEPEEALRQSLTWADRADWPAEWAGLAEERFSMVGDVEVLPDCTGGPPEIRVSGPALPMQRGLAWGRWLGQGSKTGVPVEGIALDGWAAVTESGLRVVNDQELAVVREIFPETGDPVAAGVNVLGGGKLRHFPTAADVAAIQALEAEVLALPGPDTGRELTAALTSGGTVEPRRVRQAARTAASTWTETPKSVLVLNAVFPDRTTPAGTQAQWQTVMAEVSTWLSENSFGKTNLVVTVPANVFRLPGSVASYETGERYSPLMTDAKALALAAGFDPANYNITVVAFPHISSWGWSGLASIGGGNHWLNGNRSAGTIAHEFGHNYGLNHASSWDVNDGTVLPPANVPSEEDPRHVEYGDRFSAMGSNPDDYPLGHFSHQGKAALNWITAGQVQTVTTPGTYRIHRFDHTTTGTQPKLALKLQRGGSQTLWLGYRRNYPSNQAISNGAYLLWQYVDWQCRLLDLTPNSRTSSHYDDKLDAALPLGRTFTDPTNSLYITPMAQGGTAPQEWMDVRVEFMVAGNREPVASIQPPAGPLVARTPITLTATGSDPDGDVLSYSWDLGQGQTASGASVTRTFLAGGQRRITLRVSDGRGGLLEVPLTLTIADPLAEWEEVTLPDNGGASDGIWWRGLHLAADSYYVYSSRDGGAWWQRTPVSNAPTRARLSNSSNRVVWVGGLWDSAAASELGVIKTATDGLTWETASLPAGPRLNAVASQPGRWVAVGAGGRILTSPDGVTWQAVASGTTVILYDVQPNGSGFLVTGESGTILTSSDGTAWTARTTPATWPWVQGAAGDGTRMAAVGMGDRYWWSSDGGTTWTDRSFGLQEFDPRKVCYADGYWLALDNRYRSTPADYQVTVAVSLDGTTWEALPTKTYPREFTGLRLQDGRMWLYGQTGRVVRSGLLFPGNRNPMVTPTWPAAVTARQAANFTASALTDPDGDAVELFWEVEGKARRFGMPASLNLLLGGQLTFRAVAADGRGGYAPVERSYLVEDPLLYWSNITPTGLTGSQLAHAVCSSDRAVMAGGYASLDAPAAGVLNRTNWSKRAQTGFGQGLAWRNPGFVLVGQRYDNAGSAWRSVTSHSANGQTWSAWAPQTGAGLNGLAASDTAYVAAGSGGVILRSIDGQTWNGQTSGVTTDLSAVAFVGARGLACGSNGTVLRSEDNGQTWENVSATVGQNLGASEVLAAGGYLFLSSSSKLRRYDPAARSWQDANVQSPGLVSAVVQYQGTFVGVSTRYDSTLSRNRRYLLVSLDGLAWELTEMNWPQDVRALVACGSDLLAGGDNLILANVQGTPGLALNTSTLAASRSTTETGQVGTAQLSNTGAGSLPWNAQSNVSWLGAQPARGQATIGAQGVALHQTAMLPLGTHTGTVTFAAPGVPSQTVTVTLTVFQDDHGNTTASATAHWPGTPLAGQIQTADDADWFVIDLKAPGAFSTWTTGSLDTLGELHGPTGLITNDDDSGTGSNFLIERTLLPGRYWIRVEGYSSNTGAYQLHSSFVAAGPPFAVLGWAPGSAGTPFSFTVATAPGYRYQVQISDNLAGNSWSAMGSQVTATGTQTVITVPVPEGSPARRFFRIGMQAP